MAHVDLTADQSEVYLFTPFNTSYVLGLHCGLPLHTTSLGNNVHTMQVSGLMCSVHSYLNSGATPPVVCVTETVL